jgi:hypothetical protein
MGSIGAAARFTKEFGAFMGMASIFHVCGEPFWEIMGKTTLALTMERTFCR